MNPVYPMVISATIVALLGVGHLVLTYWGPKLLPRDPALRDAMDGVSPVITTQTTIWRAWIGFNASHSIGLVLFGFLYGYFALSYPWLLFESVPLLVFGMVVLLAYVALASNYWFKTPLVGISIALVLFVISIGLARW
jgi:hypothetical protein